MWVTKPPLTKVGFSVRVLLCYQVHMPFGKEIYNLRACLWHLAAIQLLYRCVYLWSRRTNWVLNMPGSSTKVVGV